MQLNNADIVLDFFAGSCSTAQAVIELPPNAEKQCHFICVQLPENCEENSKEFKAGYATIADLGKERIRRVINNNVSHKKLNINETISKQIFGFKVFKLQPSNFKIWRTDIKNGEELTTQLEKFIDQVDDNVKIENVLYELLLKTGVPLTAKIEKNEGYYLVNENEIILMLDKVNESLIKTAISLKPKKVITLDRLFKDNDQLKTNTALQMKDADIDFRVV